MRAATLDPLHCAREWLGLWFPIAHVVGGGTASAKVRNQLLNALPDGNDMTFRVLGPHERGRFAPEAWGHLLSLNGSGVINAAELEQLIERAMTQIDGRIALDDLRSLMEGAGYDEDGTSDQTVVH